MFVARIGYVLMLAVVALAIVAIYMVLRPNSASTNPPIQVQQVVDYSRFGVIESIRQKGQTLTVRFNDNFNTEEAFGIDSRVFEATLPEGVSILTLLEEAEIPVGDGGVRVVSE